MITSNQCVLIADVIYCQCGDPSSHYGTMGVRGAREVRCEAPPREQRPSKKQVAIYKGRAVTVRGKNRLMKLAAKETMRQHLESFRRKWR